MSIGDLNFIFIQSSEGGACKCLVIISGQVADFNGYSLQIADTFIDRVEIFNVRFFLQIGVGVDKQHL